MAKKLPYRGAAYFTSLIFIIITAAATIFGQTAKPGCPTAVFLGSKEISSGFPLMMPVFVSGGDPQYSPTFNWDVTGASILEGQGSWEMTVDTAALPVGAKIKIAVELGGAYPCPERFETTAEVKKTAARLNYIYDKATMSSRRNAELQAIAKELVADTALRAYVFAYTGYGTTMPQAQERADQAVDYILKQGVTDAKQVVRIDGGAREIGQTELWIVPKRATPPVPKPAKP